MSTTITDLVPGTVTAQAGQSGIVRGTRTVGASPPPVGASIAP